MPTYRPLSIARHRGLNLRLPSDQIAPGEATVSNNIDYSAYTIKKRRGRRRVLTGSLDNVLRGGPASSSLYFQGSEYWLEHREKMLAADGSANATTLADFACRSDFFHHRQGIAVIPEDTITQLRLDVKDGAVGSFPNWAIEWCLWTDDLPTFRWTNSAAAPQTMFVPIVAAKSRDTAVQWAVRLLPDATSTDRFYVALTLFEGSVETAGTDFFYASGADRAWVEPGRRIWVAWKFDQTADTVTSYYWIEGATSVVSSSAATVVTLKTNGVGGAAYAVSVGKRPRLRNKDTVTENREMGFNGAVSEMRLWYNTTGALSLPANWGTVTANPPASTDWFVDREITDEQLTTDASIETPNIVQSNDLKLYYQFKPELIGTDNLGAAVSGENHRFIRPRFRSGGAVTQKAWLSGADATWVPASGALGSFALALAPSGPSGQLYEYVNCLRTTQSHFCGYKTFTSGIRIPNATAYLHRAVTGSTAFDWPDAFSVRVAFRCDALPKADGADLTTIQEVLWEMAVVRRGPGGAIFVADYAIDAVLRLSIVWDGAAWKLRWQVLDGAGVSTTIFSTTTIVEGTTYVGLGTVRWWGATNREMSLFLDGAKEATSAAAGSKPWLSQTTAADTIGSNKDGDDGRDQLFPMSIGYSNRVQSARTTAPPDPWTFRVGSFAGTDAGYDLHQQQANERSYWAHHTNDAPNTANDGVAFRGENAFVGLIGSVQVWHQLIGESEARRFKDRAPDAQESMGYGASLLSNWDMDEGQGTFVYDKGYLKNHLRINPFPIAKMQSAAVSRLQRPALLGFWQRRERQVRSGTPVRELFALGGGCLHKMQEDGSLLNYVAPIGRCLTPELYEPTNVALRLPTSFDFSESKYICTGLGPVKRITNGKLLDAGLTPPFGDIGQDQTHLGWREFDRDGTFHLWGIDSAGAASQVFVEGGKYSWCMSYFDPESGIESAPSRKMFATAGNYGTSPGNGWSAVILELFPHPPQRNVTKYRIYRTVKDGSQWKFLDEIDISASYADNVPDRKLGFALTSDLNFPPPLNARLGVAFGARIFYSGVPESPGTVFYSLLGQPGSVPPQYQITFPDEITALLVLNDRVLACTKSTIYALFDAGGDISTEATSQPPVQYAVMTTELGCLGHHTAVMVPGYGWIFASERGLYATDGSSFRYLSEKIEPYWRTLNFNAASRFCATAHKRRGQYLMACSTTSSATARNDQILVLDYERGAFSIYTNIDCLFMGTIEDEDTGLDRVFMSDYLGNLWDFDPADASVLADGVTAAPFSGTIQDKKKDPLGSGKFSRLKLVTNSSLPTGGTGLRGVNLYITNAGTQWHTIPLKIIWNDANWVWVEPAAANTTDPLGFEWRLGAIDGDYKGGFLDLGSESTIKKVDKIFVDYGSGSGSALSCTNQFLGGTVQTRALTPTRTYDTIAPVLGRGRMVQTRFHDSTLFGGLPNNEWEIANWEVHWHPRTKASMLGK